MNTFEEFSKIINDFRNDLMTVFPELKPQLTNLDMNQYFHYCKDLYPENFFHILYENDELFDDEQGKFLLPEIDFSVLMKDESLSESSKKTIWKYIQLILFSVCNELKDKKNFGDANYLFEAIKEDELNEKIEETMKEMKDVFMNMDTSNNENMEHMFENMMNDISGVEHMFNDASCENPFEKMFNGTSCENPFENTMDADKMKSHLSDILGGKIGNLAKEIAQEASTELGIDDTMDEESQKSFMKNLFKNPAKLMDIVKNIGSKLESKFKSGEIKESELMEEAKEIMGKMNDLPGLKEMMGSMGMNPGGKFDFKGMANKMQQNMKTAKTKERMKEKLEKNRAKQQQEANLGTIHNVGNETFVWNDSNSKSNEPLQKSKKPPVSKKKKNKGKKKKN
uniref:Uncharacterized protein n=1 Tax=viral metagenome TaxID=1070528 RepID=A0A6C0KK62_9ZZZZ